MAEEEIIWKAIDTNGGVLLGKGNSKMNSQLIRNILSSYQNVYNSVIIELFDQGCTERLGVFSNNKFIT